MIYMKKNYSKEAAKAFGRVVCKNIEETTKDENIEVTIVPVLHSDITLVSRQVPAPKKIKVAKE
jgi:hypothetical protein